MYVQYIYAARLRARLSRYLCFGGRMGSTKPGRHDQVESSSKSFKVLHCRSLFNSNFRVLCCIDFGKFDLPQMISVSCMIDHLSFLMSNARLTPMQVPRSTSIKSNRPSGFALPAITSSPFPYWVMSRVVI